MSFTKLSSAFSVSPQITKVDVERAAREGFRLVIDCRPDDEEQGQSNFRDVAEWAAEARRFGETCPGDAVQY